MVTCTYIHVDIHIHIHMHIGVHTDAMSNIFHLPVIKHKFAEHSLRYCLIKQLNREKCSILITSKVHTHSFQGYKGYLKNKAINIYSCNCNILNAMFAKN